MPWGDTLFTSYHVFVYYLLARHVCKHITPVHSWTTNWVQSPPIILCFTSWPITSLWFVLSPFRWPIIMVNKYSPGLIFLYNDRWWRWRSVAVSMFNTYSCLLQLGQDQKGCFLYGLLWQLSISTGSIWHWTNDSCHELIYQHVWVT